MPLIEFSVQAEPQDASTWADLARRSEDLGMRALLVPDHPGAGASPFVALGAAAAVTTSLRLGSYVLNTGVREAIHIASDVATLDVVSGGRAEVGLGAGHTPREWEMVGRTRPPARARVAHLIETASTVRRLLDGDTVPTDDGDTHQADDGGTSQGNSGETNQAGNGANAAHAGDTNPADDGESSFARPVRPALTDLRLDEPRPVQSRVPLLVGGTSATMLRWAGANADAVGLTGLGPTRSDGHRHEITWSPKQVDRHVGWVREGSERAGRPMPELEVLVQVLVLTADREGTITDLAGDLDAPPHQFTDVPYILIGTRDQIVEQLIATHERWGITRFVVRAGAMEAAGSLMARLAA